jgi:hypothetical protein
MTARANRKADRISLLQLTNALRVSQGRIKKDACSDWNIFARRGHISTDGTGCFYIYVQFGSPRLWTFTKRKLEFFTVSQDGDDEGILMMREVSTTEQAAVIRKVLGLRKAPSLTTEQREMISRRLKKPPINRGD